MSSNGGKKIEKGEALEKNLPQTSDNTENDLNKKIKKALVIKPEECIAKNNELESTTNGNFKKEETKKKSEHGEVLEKIKGAGKTEETEEATFLQIPCEGTTNKTNFKQEGHEEKNYNTTEEVEYLKLITDKDLPLSFIQKRHTDVIEGLTELFGGWRQEDEVRTVCIALVLCLKFDITPGDIIKTKPCAKLECWRDPTIVSPNKATIQIGSRLEKQYEGLQCKSMKLGEEIVHRRARCHQCLDPNDVELKEMCLSLRKRSKEERILLHYNGHGVVLPSELGEFFVYNKDYTKYMPFLIWDLIQWIKPPIVFVFDCSQAGKLINNFEQYLKLNQNLYEVDLATSIIQLGACNTTETLPMRPDLPADVFTSCLTTPIKMAMYWQVVVNRCRLVQNIDRNLLDKIPGKLSDRGTMLGELYWIFIAITDTIAWDTFSPDLFHQLYRQDEILASLFRNYLLAERIMKAHSRTTVTYPKLPPTFKHNLWNTWDYILEEFLTQLHDVVICKKSYKPSTFFTDQLIAFERWLRFASEDKGKPEQLPILLQVLLNTTYRMQALELLVKFVDLGPWAVNLALSIGIFPYMLQLLNKKTKELQEPLVFIWAKILAVDNSCQVDLILDNDCKYFITILKDHSLAPIYRTLAAFVLATVVNNFAAGQFAALGNSLITICLEELSETDIQLKQWVIICLAKVWDKYSKARWTGVRDNAHDKLYPLLRDPSPEVRAAAVYALGTFLHSVDNVSEHANKINQSIAITLIDQVCHDMNPLVRQELVAALQWIVLTYQNKFIDLAAQESNIDEDTFLFSNLKRSGSSLLPLTANSFNLELDSPQNLRRTVSISFISSMGSPSSPPLRYSPFNVKTWAALCSLEADPHPKVAEMSAVVTNYVKSLVNTSVEVQRRTSSSNRNREFQVIRQPLVTTEFVSWAHKIIALPLLKTSRPEDDPESKLNYDREERMQRNANIRTKAHAEFKRAFNCITYSQIYSTVHTVTPALLKFHPYEPQIAVGGQNSFTIYNFDQKRDQTRSLSIKKLKLNNTKKITALEWVNAHDVGLIMSGFDDGTVELWKPGTSSNKETTLVSAWKVYNELIPPNKLIPSDVLLTWEQWTQTVIASGSGRMIRLWDAEQELHVFDIPTGCKHPVTCMDSIHAGRDHNHMVVTSKKGDSQNKDGLITAGFADGSIRLYDRRCRPRDAQIMNFMDHTSNILAMHLHRDYIISGCMNGYVRIYDIRSKAVSNTYFEPQLDNLSAISIHRNSQIYAWGSRDRYISIFNMFGDNLNTIRFQEGSLFSTRIGAINCLALHPHRVMLAAGTADSSVILYSIVQ